MLLYGTTDVFNFMFKMAVSFIFCLQITCVPQSVKSTVSLNIYINVQKAFIRSVRSDKFHFINRRHSQVYIYVSDCTIFFVLKFLFSVLFYSRYVFFLNMFCRLMLVLECVKICVTRRPTSCAACRLAGRGGSRPLSAHACSNASIDGLY